MNQSRRGMIIVIVVGVLVFTMILFASLVNRVRHESSLTARTSINEQLYQFASSIGRIVVRKLQRDIETWDSQGNNDIVAQIFKGQSVKSRKECTNEVKDLDVIVKMLKSNEHPKGHLAFRVFYSLEMGAADVPNAKFSEDLPGLATCDLEQRGSLNVEVEVDYAGFGKKCIIKRPFFLARLLAAPFHKFTLFATNGAGLKRTGTDRVNRLQKVNSSGVNTIKFEDDSPPLVLFNKRIKDDKPGQDALDFRLLLQPGAANADNLKIFKTEETLAKNGWVFLGGSGESKDLRNNPGALILNVCAGSNEPIKSKFFGESFHFYYSDESNGWVRPDKWNAWLGPFFGGSPRISITYVDFGHIARGDFKFNTVPLFEPTIKAFETTFRDETWRDGSALHLFGTSSLCTPTLVFGPVKRRYLRTSSFLFNDIGRVFPIRGMDKTYWENSFATEMGDFLERKGFKRADNRGFFLDLENLLKNSLKHELALNGEADKDSLMPFFIDTEPYLCGLRNIGKPDDANDPTMTWGTVFPPTSTYLPKPDKLMKNFPFVNDAQIHYTGDLESIRFLPPNYLAEKTSYYLKNDPTGGSGGSSSASGGSSGVCKISQKNHPFVKFLMRKKFIGTTNPCQVSLSQIIRISGDLVIDKPLDIVKGGIIICDGKITIEAPIKNHWFNNTPNSFDDFGFLTLISKKGIDINLPPTPTGKFGYPEMHAFLVCMTGGSGEIKLPSRKPVHIVGGVAADKIDELVKYGGVIEWGFEPPEIADGKDLKEGGYFGLALGPRDIEVVVED